MSMVETKKSLKVDDQIDFTKILQAGIYIIDKYYCKNKVILSSNNKTNALINNQYLYMMLNNSINKNMFLPFPKKNKKYTFDICKSFVE